MNNKILVTRSSMPTLEEYMNEIAPMWESHWLTNMGPKHKELQAKLCEYLDVENIDLLTNGHMALELTLQAMNLQGEVITTPFTFASTTHAIVRNGLTPVFCDIDPETYCMDAGKIEGLITDKTCAIASMLHLLKELTFADFDYQVDGYETHNVQNLEEDFNTVFRYVADNADPRKLYVRRDSFSTAMAPYIGSQFNESYFRYSNTYSYEDFAEQHPDVYVYETVERLAYTLKDFSIQ